MSKPIRYVRVDGTTAEVSAPRLFSRNWRIDTFARLTTRLFPLDWFSSDTVRYTRENGQLVITELTARTSGGKHS